MPQLDPTWFVSQFFWLCICFFTMLFLMSKIFIPKISDILEQRQRKIDDYLVKANQLKEQAEESLKKYQEALAKATAEANLSIESTRKEMNEYIAKKQNDLSDKLSKRLEEGENKINEAHKKAVNDVKNMAQNLALDVAAKIGVEHLAADDVKDTIAQLVKK